MLDDFLLVKKVVDLHFILTKDELFFNDLFFYNSFSISFVVFYCFFNDISDSLTTKSFLLFFPLALLQLSNYLSIVLEDLRFNFLLEFSGLIFIFSNFSFNEVNPILLF